MTTTRHTNKNRHTKPSTENQLSSQSDIYACVTAKIITDLEAGNLTWRKPWNAEHLSGQVLRPLRWNDIPYQGVNTLMLWGTTAEQGYASPYWMTFKQALELDAHVRKGEKASQIVYADKLTVEDKDASGETVLNKIPFLKPYAVFNADQIEGLPDHYYKRPEPATGNGLTRDESLETFFAQTKADIYTGREASYSITADRVQMPPLESFQSVADYYAILAHEVCHWTRHPTRLDRDFGRKAFGDEGYAKSWSPSYTRVFLAADLGFEPMPETQHAAYIQSWLQALQNDKRFIFQAASHAQKATEYLHCLQPS